MILQSQFATLKNGKVEGKNSARIVRMASSQKEPYLKPGQAVIIALLDMPHILLLLLSKYFI